MLTSALRVSCNRGFSPVTVRLFQSSRLVLLLVPSITRYSYALFHYVNYAHCIYIALCLHKSTVTKNNHSERQMFITPKHKLIIFQSVSQGHVACLLLVCTIILQVYSAPLEDSTWQQPEEADRYYRTSKH